MADLKGRSFPCVWRLQEWGVLLSSEILYGYPYKAGISEGTDTAGNQAGKPHWHDRTVGAEYGGCRKADTAYGCKNKTKSYTLNLTNVRQYT